MSHDCFKHQLGDKRLLQGTTMSLYREERPYDDISLASNIQGTKQLNQQLGDSLQKAGITGQAF